MSTPQPANDTEKFEAIELNDKLSAPATAKIHHPRTFDSEFPLRASEDLEKPNCDGKAKKQSLFANLVKKDTFIHITTRLSLFCVNCGLLTVLVMAKLYDSGDPMKWLYYSTLVLSAYTILNSVVFLWTRSAWHIMARFWIFLEFCWVFAITFSVACAGMLMTREAKERDPAYQIANPNGNLLAACVLILAIFQLILCLYSLCLTCLDYERYQKEKILELPVYCGGPIPNHPYGPWAQRPHPHSQQRTATTIPAPEATAIKIEDKVQPVVNVQPVRSSEDNCHGSSVSSAYSPEHEDQIVVDCYQGHDGQSSHDDVGDIKMGPHLDADAESFMDLRNTAGGAFINSTTDMDTSSKGTLETVVDIPKN